MEEKNVESVEPERRVSPIPVICNSRSDEESRCERNGTRNASDRNLFEAKDSSSSFEELIASPSLIAMSSSP